MSIETREMTRFELGKEIEEDVFSVFSRAWNNRLMKTSSIVVETSRHHRLMKTCSIAVETPRLTSKVTPS